MAIGGKSFGLLAGCALSFACPAPGFAAVSEGDLQVACVTSTEGSFSAGSEAKAYCACVADRLAKNVTEDEKLVMMMWMAGEMKYLDSTSTYYGPGDVLDLVNSSRIENIVAACGS